MTRKVFKTESFSGREVTAITDDQGGLEHLDLSVAATGRTPVLSVILKRDQAVALAQHVLAEFAPDVLGQPPYVPLAERVGQFVWSDTHLDLVKIIGPDLRTDPLRYSDYDYAEAIDERGRKRYIHNRPDHEWWVPTEIEIVPEQWKPKR